MPVFIRSQQVKIVLPSPIQRRRRSKRLVSAVIVRNPAPDQVYAAGGGAEAYVLNLGGS